MKLLFFLVGILLIDASSVKAADNTWLEKLINNLKQLTEKQDIKKIHIHTDRDFYQKNDTVWYKLYLVEAESLQPSQSSAIATVALLSAGNRQVSQQKISVKSGLAAGHLVFPDTLKPGHYTITAYTNWMRNSGPEFFFRKGITILPDTKPENNPVPKAILAELSFFPEGGYLVAGLTSKVGFKAINEKGTGIQVSGSINDETGKVITTFKSLYAGMGSFSFTPVQNKKYTVKLDVPANNSSSFTFPEVKSSGLVITADNSNDSLLIIKISGTPSWFQQELVLIVQSRNTIRFSEKVILQNAPGNPIWIPKKKLSDGISQITLFNPNGLPEAERLVFIQNNQLLKIQLIPEEKNYTRRKPVNFTIQTLDYTGKPIAAEISLAATDPNQTGTALGNNSILSNLLLSSDLAGIVEDPASYFSSNSLETRQALDNLLLTQGWRRFTWQQVSGAETYKTNFLPEITLYLEAIVLKENLPVSAFIYFLDIKTGKSYVVKSDESGIVSLDLPQNQTGTHLIYQVWQHSKFLKDAVIKIKTPSDFKLPVLADAILNDSLVLQKNMLRTQIERSFSLKYPQSKTAGRAPLSWLKEPADKRYLLGNYEPIEDFEEALKEIVPDVRILTALAEPEPRMINKDQRDFFRHQPMYIIDGQPTWNNELMLRLNGDQIREIRLYNSAKTLEQFGFIGNQGVIVVETKAGNFKLPEPEAAKRLLLGSFVQPREFYVPKFTNPQIPDLRPTVYWNPTIKTGADGKATITFPASDAAAIRVYAEGITNSGLIGIGKAELKLNITP